MKKKEEKKAVVISEGIAPQRKRISFRDYARGKESVELVIDWIFLPIKFPSYGLLLSDGNDEYRISYSVRPETMDKIFDIFGMKVGKDYHGKLLLVKKSGSQVSIEEGENDASYVWVSGKGWRLEIEKEDIPF